VIRRVAGILLATVSLVSSHGGTAALPGESRARSDPYGDIYAALSDEKFERLDELYAQLGAPGARNADGTWTIEIFVPVFEITFRNWVPSRIDALFAHWKSEVPGSPLRPIAEAFAWQQRAWKAKGTGCYAQADSASRHAFNRLLDSSAAALREAEPGGKSSPLWYVAAIRVAGGQALLAGDLDALLDEADRRFPAYEPLYAARLEFLEPVWGGDFGRIDHFVRDAVKRTRAREGRAFYALLYVRLASAPGCEHLFEQSEVSWPDMKDAFEDLVARHPDNRNRNLFATFACRARDVDTTRRLLGELGKAASLGAYSPGVSNESCYRMIQPPSAPTRVSLTQGMFTR
jgi:hypothetical protein